MSTMAPSPASIESIMRAAKSGPSLDASAMDSILHAMSPRVRFLKSAPACARLLDVGAGDGAMEMFRQWLPPRRDDIRMYAVSLEKGERFGQYDGFELGNFNHAKPDFGGLTFDAMLVCHFVEHIDGGLGAFLAWAKTRLAPGGRVYVEFPSLYSKLAPKRADLIARGLQASCCNFYDDHTHVDTISLEDTRQTLEDHGFFVEESGYWRNPYLEDALIRRGYAEKNEYLATVGVWMKTYFCQYAVGVLG
jgi:SAM-dependent methyltransferase